MNFSGKKIISKKYGIGYVKGEPEGNKIKVEFEDGREAVFSTDQSFALGVVCFENEELNEYVKGLSENRKEAEAEEIKKVVSQVENTIEVRPSSGRTGYQNKRGGNIAVKCTYCDGGKDAVNVGFKGICSAGTMRYNTENRVWCQNPGCPCKQYMEGKISRKELEATDIICYESQMLNKWRISAGRFHSGDAKGEAKTIKSAGSHGLVILTTLEPNGRQEERYIFGAFIYNKISEGDKDAVGYAEADLNYTIALTPDEAESFSYWEFCENKTDNPERKRFWGSNLIRYFDDDTAVKILKRIIEIKKGTSEEAKAQSILNRFCELQNITKPMEYT